MTRSSTDTLADEGFVEEDGFSPVMYFWLTADFKMRTTGVSHPRSRVNNKIGFRLAADIFPPTPTPTPTETSE
jgi:hypothetical protein